MRISMMSPMPFCPSFDPCAKLTPVQVNTSSPRIHSGGALPLGALYRSSFLISALQHSRRSAAAQKPTIGDTRREVPTSEAFAQLTPSPNTCPLESIEFANPTPMMAPISVCELDAGRPRYHVPRFQRIAEISSAK